MFYNPITSIFRIFYEINDFEEIQNGGSKMAAILVLKRHSNVIIVAYGN